MKSPTTASDNIDELAELILGKLEDYHSRRSIPAYLIFACPLCQRTKRNRRIVGYGFYEPPSAHLVVGHLLCKQPEKPC